VNKIIAAEIGSSRHIHIPIEKKERLIRDPFPGKKK
jgi:hypothetical protein